MRPVIGISMSHGSIGSGPLHYELSSLYPAAIEKAGGLPVLLPYTHDPDMRAEMLSHLHGLLIPGGDDIDPSVYGQPPHPATSKIDPLRQAFDLAMLSLAEQHGLPVLGICMGFQIMNVQRGGSLHQHIADLNRANSIDHNRKKDGTEEQNAWHKVKIAGGSGLGRIYRTNDLEVNSRHHQTINHLGYGLLASASSPDDLIEALEDVTLDFWIGVQWHAEGLTGEPHTKLFSAFVAAADEFARNGGTASDATI